jgi:magnesium transporter
MNSVRRRLPWLLLSLGGALIAVAIVRWLLPARDPQVALLLAILIPIVITMGSNAATQTMTVVVRGIGLGEVSWETRWRVTFKEAVVGLTNGLVIGVAVSLIVGLWFDMALGSVIGLTMVLSLLFAGMLGTLVPVLLKRFKVDPALASSVFVVTFTDIVTFFFYLGIAALLLRAFKL